MVLTVKVVVDLEEFLRLSQRELHSSLSTVKTKYVTAIRQLAETAMDKRVKALGDTIRHLYPHIHLQFPKGFFGTWFFGPYEVEGVN